MQQELQNLQPELIKTSANTEQLMIKIEQDTVEVEAKREVRSQLRRLQSRVLSQISRHSHSDKHLCPVARTSLIVQAIYKFS